MGCCRDESPIQISDQGISSCHIDDDSLSIPTPWEQHSINEFWSDEPVPIQVKLRHPKAKVPQKAHVGDMGWDICCVDDGMWHNCLLGDTKEPCLELMPFESHTFSTGLEIAVPHNYGFLVRERSGLGIRDIAVRAGVIEGTYRGEWLIHLVNLGKKPRIFHVGDKIAQAILTPIIPGQAEVVKYLPDTERAEKGFGSSGR